MPEPRDIVVSGDGTQAASYQLPGAVYQYVQAIFVDVDTTGTATPVEPTLSITNGSGVVIAKQRQGEPIDPGISGSATWAQGLPRPATAAVAAAGLHLIYDYTVTNVLGQVTIDTLNDGPNAGLIPQTFTSLFAYARMRRLGPVGGIGVYGTIILNNHVAAAAYDYANTEAQENPALAWFGQAVAAQPWVFPIATGPDGTDPWATLELALPWYSDASTFQAAAWRGGLVAQSAPVTGELYEARGTYRFATGITRLALQAGSGIDNFAAGSRLTIFAG